MAQVVLGAVGAVVGFYVGGPQGAAYGWSIGSAVGAAVDPTVTRQQGPRMSDLSIQMSTWGMMLPIPYGTMRYAGNVIDASQIRETANVQSESAKGGPELETTTYSYAVDLAVSLGEGPISAVRKIWAYGRLIYNVGDDADLDTVYASNAAATGFRIYQGTETQLPDPTLEAIHGVGNVPAYRGQAYIVFENFQLGDYGNRVPNFEFEVIKAGATSFLRKTIFNRPAVGAGFAQSFMPDSESFWRFQGRWDGNYTRPFVVDVSRTLFDGSLAYFSQITLEGGGTGQVVRLKSDDIGMAYRSGSPSEIVFAGITGFQERYSLPTNIGGDQVKAARGGDYFVAGSNLAGQPVYLWSRAEQGPPIGSIPAITDRFVAGALISEGSLYLLSRVTTVLTIERYSLPDLVLQETIPTAIGGVTVNFEKTSGGGFYILAADRFIYLVDAAGTRQIGLIDSPEFSSVNHVDFFYRNGVFFINHRSGSTEVVTTYALGVSSTAIPLAEIIRDQCLRAGVTAFNTSEITESLIGYVIKRQGSARANIDQLQKYGFFDAVESDNVVKFPLRGRAAVATILYDELAAHDAGAQAPEALPMIRLQEVDLPRRVTVNYINSNGDYQVGSEHAQRLITESDQEATQELAIAMPPDKAARIADVLLYDAHNGRTRFSLQATSRYARLEPTDVILAQGVGVVYSIRLDSREQAAGIFKFTGTIEDASIYTSTATGGSDNPTQGQIGPPGPTRAEYLDIPLIRDQDDNSGFYAPMTGFRDSWRGATLFKSFDDLSFSGVGTVLNHATIGFTNTALGDWASGNLFDETNSVDVTLYYGELVSATPEDLLNSVNACVIGNEILQFKNAILIGTNQYRLSGFLRGRRGTEQRQTGHVTNERFVLMTVAGTLRPDGGVSEIGALRYYKPVSIGQRQTDVPSQEFTNTAQGLRPYSPAQLRGGRQTNDDYILQWDRRTRVGGAWRSSVEVSLGETTEAYEVDIMQGATVKRTMTSSTPTVTYTAAMQTTDFGSHQTSITVNIYQMSSVVGRGFPATKTY